MSLHFKRYQITNTFKFFESRWIHLLCRKTSSTSTMLTLITLNLGSICGLLVVLTVNKPHGRKYLNYSHASELWLSDYLWGLAHEDLAACQRAEADGVAGSQRAFWRWAFVLPTAENNWRWKTRGEPERKLSNSCVQDVSSSRGAYLLQCLLAAGRKEFETRLLHHRIDFHKLL